VVRFRPDGRVVLPSGEWVAVGVEAHAKAAGRLAAKLRWYRDGAAEGTYAEVPWLVSSTGVEEGLWDAIAGVDPMADLMAVDRLPDGHLRYIAG